MKNCYRCIVGPPNLTDKKPWAVMWKFLIPPKVKTFFWRACSNSLPTSDLLAVKKVPCSLFCHLCLKEPESIEHIFVHCEKSRLCWNIMGGISFARVATFREWVEYNFTQVDVATYCLFVTICWKIWDAKNDALWNQKKLPASGYC